MYQPSSWLIRMKQMAWSSLLPPLSISRFKRLNSFSIGDENRNQDSSVTMNEINNGTSSTGCDKMAWARMTLSKKMQQSTTNCHLQSCQNGIQIPIQSRNLCKWFQRWEKFDRHFINSAFLHVFSRLRGQFWAKLIFNLSLFLLSRWASINFNFHLCKNVQLVSEMSVELVGNTTKKTRQQ